MRFVKVAKVIRAGSHPSPNATTRRQAAGVEDEKDAIRIANDVRYGLMATVWTGDAGR